MANTALPVITGTTTEKQLLTVSDGTWTNVPTSFSRQWVRCDTSGNNCVLIPSAVGSTYMLTAADVGASIRCWLTAFNSTGASEAVVTAKTATIAAYAPAVPVNVTTPVITGTATQGQTLAVSNGTWTNLPTGYTYQWQRCDSAGANAVSISGATTSSYVLALADVGATIRCRIVAVNAAGSSSGTQSSQTSVIVALPAPPPTGLGSPTNFRVTGVTSTTITATWDAVSGATGYYMAISPASAPTSTVYTDGGSSLSYTWTALSPSTSYQPDVRAYSASLFSAWAGRISASTLAGVIPSPPATKRFGVNVGKWFDASHNPSRITTIGAKIGRIEYGVGASATTLDAYTLALANVGIKTQPLAGFTSGVLPTTAQAQNLRNWALRHGPLGTNRISLIEFGNETSYSYQWPGGTNFFTIGSQYAVLAKAAAIALQGTQVGLLVQADDALNGPDWVNGLFSGAPDILNYVAGWTCHPYGPAWGPTRIDRMKTYLANHGDTSKPIYFTEFGIASDNGRSLDDNYGYPVNMTYQQAADALAAAHNMWLSKLGTRWVQTIIFSDWDSAATGTSVNREYYFGVLRSDGSSKGPWTTAVQQRMAS